MPKIDIKKPIALRATRALAKSQTSNVRKLKLLVTIVDKSKSLFYLDLLEQFEVAYQNLYLADSGTFHYPP